MADPIVFDCGGSTRIKKIELTGVGDMADLLDVRDLTGPGAVVLPGTGWLPDGATGSQETIKPGAIAFAGMIIMFQDAAGIPFTIPVAALPNGFLIASNLDQNVRGDFVPVSGGNPNLILTVFSPTDDPIVAAKQQRIDHPPRRRRRRYVIDNAGPIKTITLNDHTPTAVVAYDSTLSEGPPAAVPIVSPGVIGPAGGPVVPVAGLSLYVSVIVF
jgi:hypothetical protein